MKEIKIKNKKSRVFAGGHVKFTVQMKAFLKKFPGQNEGRDYVNTGGM
jgi:hypothetical protein